MDQKMCPKMDKTLKMLGKKWNGLIVYSLLEGPKKFSAIEKHIDGISARMLTERLKELEKEEVVIKTVFLTTPIKIEYTLTKKGMDLGEAYKAIGKWAEKWN